MKTSTRTSPSPSDAAAGRRFRAASPDCNPPGSRGVVRSEGAWSYESYERRLDPMKRFPRTPALAVLAFAAQVAARAQDGPAARGAWSHGMRPMAMEKCLATLDLSADVRANVDNALAGGRATLKADGLAIRTADDKMQADLANGAEKSVLGQDAIDLD